MRDNESGYSQVRFNYYKMMVPETRNRLDDQNVVNLKFNCHWKAVFIFVPWLQSITRSCQDIGMHENNSQKNDRFFVLFVCLI